MKKLIAILLLLVTTVIAAVPAFAAPLTCDSELQTFSVPDKLMRVTSKYVYKLPDGSTADTAALDAGIETYFDGALAAILQLRDSASSGAQVKGAADIGSVWRVTGEPVCVMEPEYNDAVTIYVPVASYDNQALTGFLIESRNWKNIELSDLTVSAPTDTIKRLSLYFLEPQIVNPQVNLDLDISAVVPPEPVCAYGSPSYAEVGEAAKRYIRIVDGPYPPEEIFEYDYGIAFGAAMPLFGEVVLEDSYDSVGTSEWYDFFYEDLKSSSQYAVLPGSLWGGGDDEIQIIDGPACSRIHYEVTVESVDGDTLGFYYQLATLTWFRIRVTHLGQQYEGWFPESIRWQYFYLNFLGKTINHYFDFYAYYLNPVPSDEATTFYVDNWNILGDLELGEPSTKHPASMFGFTGVDSPGESCDGLLPTRLAGAPRARVIVPALNLRDGPSLDELSIIGMGQNSVVTLLGPTRCADGLRWWAAELSGGQLGTNTYAGWAAENDSAMYYLEPVADAGGSVFVDRPNACPADADANAAAGRAADPAARANARPHSDAD